MDEAEKTTAATAASELESAKRTVVADVDEQASSEQPPGREMQESVFGLQTPVPTNAAEYATQYAVLLLVATAAAAGSGAFFLDL